MTNAPDRPANPFVNFGQQGSRRMGATPAATGPTESVYTSLRITVERKTAFQSYRLFGSGSYVYFPCQGNTLVKPILADGLRPEDDMKINWRVKWFTDEYGHKTIMRIADATTGEVLAATNTQPALIETTVDEKTGQLTTEKSTSPFGRLGLPAETVEKARIRGEELRAEREKREIEMANKPNSEAIAEFNSANAPDATPWTKTPGLLSKFWETIFAEYGIFSKSEAPARALVIEKLGTDPATWPTLDECYTIAEAALEGFNQTKIEAAKPKPETAAKAPEPTPAAIPVPETPATPASDVKTPVENAGILGMSEAGFSITFKWVDGDGSEQQFTMRAETWQQGLKELPAFHAALRTLGYMPHAEYTKAHPAPAAPVTQAIAPAPTNGVAPAPVAAPVAAPASDGGSFVITEVKKFQDEGKTEYHLFEAGRDRPAMKLRVKGDQDKLAQHIDLNQMVVGQRYALSIIAEWTPSANVGRDGNPFKNLKALRKAAA